MRMQHGASDDTQYEQSQKRNDLPSASSAGPKVTLASGSDDPPSGSDGVREMEESNRGQSDIDELSLNPHQQSTAIWPDPRAQTIEENDIFTVEGIPNLDPTTRVRASYESNHWSLHDPADPEQRFWLFGYDSGEPSTSSSSSELFISMKASVIEYPVGRQLSEKLIKLTALNHSSGLTLLSVLEHRKKLQTKSREGLQRAATVDVADSSANPSGSNSAGLPPKLMDRPMNQPSVWPDHSSYWSVSELQDFEKNIAHFGTNWHAIARNMPTKTHPMVKIQYLRLVEQGRTDLEQAAREADRRREQGDYPGPPPTPTPAAERRFMSTQSVGNVAESVLDGSNATKEKSESTQSAPQTDTAPGSHGTMAEPPTELLDSTANNPTSSSHSVSSYTINAYIGQGDLEDLDISLLTKAQLNLSPEYYELFQHGVNKRYNHADMEWMHIRGNIVSIGQESNTLFLSAPNMSDINIITKNIGKAGVSTVVYYDSSEESDEDVKNYYRDESDEDLEDNQDITEDLSMHEFGSSEAGGQPQMDTKAKGVDPTVQDNDEGVRSNIPPLTKPSATPKGILRPPTKTFPEDPEPIREGVAPLKDSVRGKDVPVNARWTKIDRRLVNPEALEEAKERFEERMDCIIVLRVLTKEEIQKLADRTKEIREQRNPEGNVFYHIEQELH
jgi:hypothetical protein